LKLTNITSHLQDVSARTLWCCQRCNHSLRIEPLSLLCHHYHHSRLPVPPPVYHPLGWLLVAPSLYYRRRHHYLFSVLRLNQNSPVIYPKERWLPRALYPSHLYHNYHHCLSTALLPSNTPSPLSHHCRCSSPVHPVITKMQPMCFKVGWPARIIASRDFSPLYHYYLSPAVQPSPRQPAIYRKVRGPAREIEIQ